MPPRVISARISWDSVTAASGPFNLIVHRTPTNEVPTNLRICPWFFPSQTGRRISTFSFSAFPLTQTHTKLKEKSCPFGEDCHYFYHMQWWPQSSYKLRENATLFPLPFLHCDWPVFEPPPLLPTVWENWHPSTVEVCNSQPYDSWLCKESPWRQLPGNLHDELHLAVATSHGPKWRPGMKFAL